MAEEFAHITDESLEKVRRLIGTKLERIQPYLEELTKDAIRHFAEGIGDRNLLWVDESYAKTTIYGCLIAPPTMLYAFDKYANGGYAGGLPGVHAMFGGSNWEWFLPIKVGDRITSKTIFKDLVEKHGAFAGRMFSQISEVNFYNQHNSQLVARVEPWNLRIERKAAQQRDKYQYLVTESAKYTQKELEHISNTYEEELKNLRGKEPRYWEDVKVGEELPAIVRGPLTVTDLILFVAGWGGLWLKSHGRAFTYHKNHPAADVPNEQGIPEPAERVHWDDRMANFAGVPKAYDYGPERVAWLGTLMTNWIGDRGFLARLYIEVRRFNLLGDTTWCKGKVIDKRIEKEKHIVKCEVKAEDQRGEVTARGWAEALLPSRK